MKHRKNRDLLTEVELEFMTALWDIGEGPVREILARLDPGRGLAYTSAATIMRILDAKGFATSRKAGKHLIYTPTVSKDAYQTRSIQDLSAKLFDNTPAALVARLVDDEGLTQQHLADIRALLDKRLGGDSDD